MFIITYENNKIFEDRETVVKLIENTALCTNCEKTEPFSDFIKDYKYQGREFSECDHDDCDFKIKRDKELIKKLDNGEIIVIYGKLMKETKTKGMFRYSKIVEVSITIAEIE